MYEQTKTVSQRYSRKTCVSVVNGYADTVSALSTAILTHRKLLYFGKSKKTCVGVVVDYTDTV